MSELLKPFPTAFADTFTPIALGELGNDRMGGLADEVIARLAEHGVVMARGLHRAQVPRITSIARSPEVVEHCYKDERKRFSDVSAMEAWVSKDGGRQVVGAYRLSEWSGRPLRGKDLGHVAVDEVIQDSIAWGGQASPNDRRIPGSDMTAACRSSAPASALLRKRMEDPRRRVSLGYGSVVVLLAVLTHDYGIDPGRISMEQNLSNGRVTALCTDRLGFTEVDGVPKLSVTRLTQQPVGTVINGEVVRLATSQDPKELHGRNVVADQRVFRRWQGPDHVKSLA